MNVMGRLNHFPIKRYALWAAVPASVGGLWGLSYYLRREELGPAPDVPPGESLELQFRPREQQVTGQSDYTKLTTNVHTAKWSVCTTRGRDLFSQGRLDEAEKFLLEAVEHAKEGFGEDDAHVASSFNNLAELYRLKKEYHKAEPLYLQAVERLEQSMGPEHPSVAFALHNLGGFYLLQNNLPKAIDCYERALKIKGRGLGLNHPEYANTMFHLGKVMQLSGKLSEAETLIRQSIQILEEGGFGQSQIAIRRMIALTEILVQTNQLSEAENLQRKILHSLDVTQGPEAATTISASESLANTLLLRENFDEAEELLKRCLEWRQKSSGGNHIQIWASLFKLACVAMGRAARSADDDVQSAAMAEYDKAVTLLQQAIRIAEKNWNEATASPEDVKLPYFLALVQSLSMAGLVGVKRLEMTGTKTDEGVKLGEEALCRCVEEFEKEDTLMTKSTEVAQERLNCTEQLGKLLYMLGGKRGEVKKLNKEAARLKSLLPSSV